jgi:outer membrane usher protein
MKGHAAVGDDASRIYLETIVNSVSTELIAEFTVRPDERLATSSSELMNIGLQPNTQAVATDGLIDLDRLPGVSYTYDRGSQVVRIEALAASVLPHKYDARANSLRGTITPELPASHGVTGVVVNYFAFGTTDALLGEYNIEPFGRRGSASVTLESRLFGDYGVWEQSGIAGSTPQSAGDVLRLNSTWSYGDAASLVTYRAGDIVSGGLGWTRPIRLGGLQAQRSFSLRPDLVTMPLPAFSGTAGVPSAVDVFVNNVRTFSQQVPVGPFQISNLPVVSGSGTQTLVLRDATGRETVTSQQFYATPVLLRQGLYDFSAESGFRRYSFGVASDDYDGDFVASASLRGGLSDEITAEGHAEAGAGVTNGGIGTAFALRGLGVGSVAVAGSNSGGKQGAQLAASVEFDFGIMRLFARGQQTFRDYTDLAGSPASTALPGLPPAFNAQPPRQLAQATLSIPMAANASSLSLSVTHIRDDFEAGQNILGLTWAGKVFRDASMFVNGFADMGAGRNVGMTAGITFSPRPDISAQAGVSNNNHSVGSDVEFVKTQPNEPDTYGWRVRDLEGALPDREALFSYRTQAARVAVGGQQFGSSSMATGEIEGAVVVANGGVFLANRIDDAFAVVDVGAPGVNVAYENRLAGQTNADGQLLVPHLRSNESNVLSIDPNNLPTNAVVPRTKMAVVPSSRGAVVADFGVSTKGSPMLITLQDESGRSIMVGSRVTVDGMAAALTVGYDGKVYLQDAPQNLKLRVERADGTGCVATLVASKSTVPELPDQRVICK